MSIRIPVSALLLKRLNHSEGKGNIGHATLRQAQRPAAELTFGELSRAVEASPSYPKAKDIGCHGPSL